SATRNSLNSGKAVNSASTTASSGTMLRTVVKVRLEAIWVSFFSDARRRMKRAMVPKLEGERRAPSSGDDGLLGCVVREVCLAWRVKAFETFSWGAACASGRLHFLFGVIIPVWLHN